MRIFLTGILIFLSMMLLSCASSGRHAGKLSDGMEKASDDHEGERKVDAERNVEPEEEDKVESFITFKETGKTDDELNIKDLRIGISAGTGILSDESFYGMSSFSISAEYFIAEKKSASIELGGDHFPLQTVVSEEFDPSDDPVVKALEGGAITLYAGFNARFYTTPQKTFIGNYFSAGIKVRSMFWSYKNPLTVAEYDENNNYLGSVTVTSDQLWGLDMNISAGLNFIQTGHFIIGAEINPGLIIWGFETREGFENDIFEPVFYTKACINIQIK
jgi:hypothetical protein